MDGAPDGFRDVVDTNLTGYFLVARAVTPQMLAAGHGRIVNISINYPTIPAGHAAGLANLLEPEIMGPPVVWLASAAAAGLHDEQITAPEFDRWLRDRQDR